ncbi:MAG: hypothetical protein ACRCUM_01450 [Mycoplasmoidaceae bacterium]
MNKKAKITLLSLMLGASLAGVATTIASCSASSSNEIKIEHSSTLVNNVTRDLTDVFAKDEGYLKKLNTYNNIINSSRLPESTLAILKNEITFINDGNTLLWDDVVSGIKLSGPAFTQVGNGDIEAISIELEINTNYNVLGASTSNQKITTGTLGNVGIIPIFSLTETNTKFDDELSVALDAILQSKRSYQEMKATYDGWIANPLLNLPNSIINMFNSNFQFDTEGGTRLSFRNVVDNMEFVSKSTYPLQPHEKIPDFQITIKLKNDGYIFTNPEQEQILTIENIEINSATKLIDTSILSVGNTNIENAFLNYFNPAGEIAAYHEVREKFNNMVGESGIIPTEIRDVIVQNIQLNLFGYNPIPSFDDIIATMQIHPFGNATFPTIANASLPNITINFTIKTQYYQSIDQSLLRPITINLSRVRTGSVKYEVSINPTLADNVRDVFSEILIQHETWQHAKASFDTWTSYDSLSGHVHSWIENRNTGISFTPIGLSPGEVSLGDGVFNSISFDDLIASVSISKEKPEFPEAGSGIGAIYFEFNMRDNIFYTDNLGNDSTTIFFESSEIGGVTQPVAINISISDTNKVIIREKIQEKISDGSYLTNKNTYESWNNISNLGQEIENIIKNSLNVSYNGYPPPLTIDALFTRIPIIDKDEYPDQPLMLINKFHIKIELSRIFILPGSEREFIIELEGLISKGVI